jgi:hypothetical protein
VLPDVAVIVVVPVVVRVAVPELELAKLATAVFDEVQVGLMVAPLLVAVNRTDPSDRLAVAVVLVCAVQPEHVIVMAFDCELTVKVVTPLTPLSLAVMFVDPKVVPAVASPELLMVAMLVDDEVQVTEEVTFCWLLSPKVPVAVNC